MTTEARVTAPSLEILIAHSVRALIRRMHLNRDWIIGLIGDRGSGKSLSGANIALKDFMMSGEPCWSNMQIKMAVDVDDELSRQVGLEGGSVIYEAGHIDKQSFLTLDSRYEGGCLFFDEFNLEYGEARRSSSNVNLMTDRAVQQLRKMQCGLVYTVLNEMYVDARIRDNTDVFIRCQDVALNTGNLAEKMEQGVLFEWLIYGMTPKFAGNNRTYDKTHKPEGPYQIKLEHLWEAIDTYERQAQGATKYSDTKTLFPLKLQEDPAVIVDRDKWGWLDERLTGFFEKHANDGDIIEILGKEFQAELGVPDNMWGSTMGKINSRLKENIEQRGRGSIRYPRYYLIRNKVLV